MTEVYGFVVLHIWIVESHRNHQQIVYFIIWFNPNHLTCFKIKSCLNVSGDALIHWEHSK
jgi:hypothetical protein